MLKKIPFIRLKTRIKLLTSPEQISKQTTTSLLTEKKLLLRLPPLRKTKNRVTSLDYMFSGQESHQTFFPPKSQITERMTSAAQVTILFNTIHKI